VRNERRQERPPTSRRRGDVPLLFPRTTYYGDVIGSHADIEAARIADIRDFHQQFYTPNNASIASPATSIRPAQGAPNQYFGPILKGRPSRRSTGHAAITAQRRTTVTDTVNLPQMRIRVAISRGLRPGATTSMCCARARRRQDQPPQPGAHL